MADPEKTEEQLPELSPTGKAIIPQPLVRYAVGIVAAAVAVSLLPDLGIDLPAVVLKVDKTVLALGIILGLTSQGVRK